MECFACGAAVELRTGERVGFREVCEKCGADLHVCRNCAHHDPSAHNECREPGADYVPDRERANRCEWFRAREDGGGAGRGERSGALSDLESLFKKKR